MYIVDIDYVYSDECRDCVRLKDVINESLLEENCVPLMNKLFYLDDRTISFCIDNGIDDIPSCIIGHKYKFVGKNGFTKDLIRNAIFCSKYEKD